MALDVRELELKLNQLQQHLKQHADQHQFGGMDEIRWTRGARVEGRLLRVGAVNYTWPSADGSGSTCLTTDAVGNLSWTAPGNILAVGNWKEVYTNAAGVAQGLTLGAGDTLLVSAGASAAPVFKSLLGTTNEIIVTSAAGSLTLSTPQDIHTAATPTFAGLTLTGLSSFVRATAGVLSASAIVNADIPTTLTTKTLVTCKADTLDEANIGAGVTIDGVLLKDGYIDFPVTAPPAGTRVYIANDTSGYLILNALTGKSIDFRINGSAIGGVDAAGLAFDTINESHSGYGVTVDGVLLLDNLVGHSYLKTEQKLVAASRADYATIAAALPSTSVLAAGSIGQIAGETFNITAIAYLPANVQVRGTGYSSTINMNGILATAMIRNEHYQASGDDSIILKDLSITGTLTTLAKWQANYQESGIDLHGISSDLNQWLRLQNVKLANIQYGVGNLDYQIYGLFDNVHAQTLGGGWEVSHGEYFTFRDSTVKEACFFSGADAFRFDDGTCRSAIFGSRAIDIGNGRLTFTGSGLNDMSFGESETGVFYAARTYRIKIDGVGTPNTFTWSKDGGSTWEAAGVAITGSAQNLVVGTETTYITVTFAATTGHTLNDYWEVAFTGSHRGFVAAAGAPTNGAVSQIQFIGCLAHRWQDIGFIAGGTSPTNQSQHIVMLGNIAFQSTINSLITGAGGGGFGGSNIVKSIYAGNVAARVQGKPGFSFGFDPALNTNVANDNNIIALNIADECTQGGILLDAGANQTVGSVTSSMDGVLVGLNRILGSGSYYLAAAPSMGIRHFNTKSGTATQTWDKNLWGLNLITDQDSHAMVFMGTKGLITDILARTWGSGAYGLYLESASQAVMVNGLYLSDDNTANLGIIDIGIANIYGLNKVPGMRATQYASLPSSHNEVPNWSFEVWSAGDPVGWTHTGGGAGAAISQESGAGNFLLGSYSLKMDSGAGGAMVAQCTLSNWADFKGKYVTVSCWAKSNNAAYTNAISVWVNDGVTTSQSPKHSGATDWQLLTVTKRISTSATELTVACRLEAGAPTQYVAYFDGFMLTKSPFAMEASPDLITHTHANAAVGGTIPNTSITGLGTMSTQTASSVAITGGSITLLTTLTLAPGGTPTFKVEQPGSNINNDLLIAAGQGRSDAAGSGGNLQLNAGAGTGGASNGKVICGAFTVQMQNYGAGAATFDASGNISSVSDIRFKDRIAPLPYGLAQVLQLNPIQHGYNELSGLERDHLYGGFNAQEVQKVMPLAVGVDSRGYLTLADRPILGAAVNAIKELEGRIKQLEARVN